MSWPRHKISIPEFGWMVEVVDLSAGEIEAAVEAAGKQQRGAINAILVKKIKAWDATDEDGNALPINEASLKMLPPRVTLLLSQKLMALIAGGGDPKGSASGSELSPTSEPEPVATPPSDAPPT